MPDNQADPQELKHLSLEDRQQIKNRIKVGLFVVVTVLIGSRIKVLVSKSQ